MNQFEIIKINLPLKKTFAVSGGSADSKTNYLTMMNNRYFGEAAPSVKYGPSAELIERELQQGIDLLSAKSQINRGTLDEIAGSSLHPIARCALTEMVLHYLSGTEQRFPWEILGLATPVGIRSSMTIGLDSAISMIDAIKDSPYPILKIKMGSEADRSIIHALQRTSGKEIRVDANGAWSAAEAEEMIYHLAKAGVTIIEQPTSPELIPDWPLIRGKHTDVELFADEGLGSMADYIRLSPHVDGVNIKMEKSGGVLSAMAIAKQARVDGKKVMLGCMLGSSVEVAQSVYMSSLADYCDLDGPLLLAQDVADGISYDRESITVDDRTIIGGPNLLRDIAVRYIES